MREVANEMGLITQKFWKKGREKEWREQGSYCFKCAVCNHVCPVTRFSKEYMTRKENAYDQTYVYDLFLADETKRAQIAWKCSMCHHCIEVCPQDIKPGAIYTMVKEWSFHQYQAPESIYKLMNTILEKGTAFPMSEMTKRKRMWLGLSSTIEYPLEELEHITTKTGLKDILDNQAKRRKGSR